MPVFHDLPKALRWLRLRADLKQHQVAEAAGITASMLSSFERGKRQPSLHSLDRVLDGLGADLPQLDEALRRVRDEPPAARPRPGPGPAAAVPPTAAPSRGADAGGRAPQLFDLGAALGGEPSPEEEAALRRLLGGFVEWLQVLRAEVR